MSDYLYPPLPAMLRRGTPVIILPGTLSVVLNGFNYDGVRLSPNIWHPASSLRLDLRDPTARAHAAWYYRHSPERWERVKAAGRTVAWYLEEMAFGDPEITAGQARAALDEAARVCGGGQ